MTPDAVARAFRWACAQELKALKPGNVHVHAGGHGMTVTQFRRSAAAAAPWLGAQGLHVGERVLGAVAATRNAVGLNTNLGIILLAAPLCQAALSLPDRPLADGTAQVLRRLTRDDAVLAFSAISLANPAGLGSRATHDVHNAPRIGLVAAMRLAARRDRVARQYAMGFDDVFRLGVRSLEKSIADGLAIDAAATRLHMTFLRRFPDSHIARKFGAKTAAAVRREAQKVPDRRRALEAFDRSLKKRGLNPGTTADLVVASLLAYRLNSIVRPAA